MTRLGLVEIGDLFGYFHIFNITLTLGTVMLAVNLSRISFQFDCNVVAAQEARQTPRGNGRPEPDASQSSVLNRGVGCGVSEPPSNDLIRDILVLNSYISAGLPHPRCCADLEVGTSFRSHG